MDFSPFVPIAVSVITVIGGASIGHWYARSKNKAETESLVVKTAREVMAELKGQADLLQEDNASLRHQAAEFRVTILELRERLKEQNTEIRLVQASLENLNGKVLKYQLIISIFSMQMRSVGYEPLIAPQDMDTISVDELQNIAASLNSIQHRRENAQSSTSMNLRKTQSLK